MDTPTTTTETIVPETLHPQKRKARGRNQIRQAVETSIKALISQGAGIRETARILGISPNTVQRTKNEMKAERKEVGGLLSPELDDLALAGLRRIMTVGAKLPKSKIKGSDVNASIKTYAERRWPAKSEDAPTSINFTEVHIHEARFELGQVPHTTHGIESAKNPAGETIIPSFQTLTRENSVT